MDLLDAIHDEWRVCLEYENDAKMQGAARGHMSTATKEQVSHTRLSYRTLSMNTFYTVNNTSACKFLQTV